MQDVSYHNGATAQPGRSNFAIVPSRIIFDERLSDRHIRVLMALASYANRDRVCIVKQETIAKRLGMRREAVSRSMLQLVMCEYLEITRLGNQDGRRGRWANGYRLLFDTYGNPLPPYDGEPISVREETHKYNTAPIIVLPNAHKSDDLSAQSDTQIFECSEAHTKAGYLSARRRTALTESIEEERTGSVYGDLLSSSEGMNQKREQDLARARAENHHQVVKDLAPQIDENRAERRALWSDVKATLNLSRQQRSSWLDPCRLFEVFSGDYVLIAPTSEQTRHLRTRYAEALAIELHAICAARHQPYHSFDVIPNTPAGKPSYSQQPQHFPKESMVMA